MPLDILHHHVDQSFVSGAKIVDGDGVRVAEAARRLAFPAKSPKPFRVRTHLRGKHLYRDAVTQKNMPGAIDGSHPPLAQQSLDLILAVEDGIDHAGGIVFEDFTVKRAKTYVIFVLGVADCAILHFWRQNPRVASLFRDGLQMTVCNHQQPRTSLRPSLRPRSARQLKPGYSSTVPLFLFCVYIRPAAPSLFNGRLPGAKPLIHDSLKTR